MGAPERERFPTLWSATARESFAAEPLRADAHADVAIIGGGFTGLTAALHLARRGARAILLEAEEVGAGASGANAGFVVPHFSKADPAAVIAAMGAERGGRLLDAVAAGGDRLFSTARDNAIDCDAAQTGWLQPAHSAPAAELLRRRAELWSARGRPVSFLGAEETAAQTGIARYRGALLDRSGGTIHPLSYARGLARLAAAAGAAIHERSPVAAVEPDGGRWRLRVGAFTARADKVLLCGNASMIGAARRLAAAIVPLSVYQIATEPLSPDVARRVAPERRPVSDTRGNVFTWRLDRDDRLISGGMAIVPIAAHRRMANAIVRRLARELDLKETPRVDFVWRGTAAMTPDFLPHVYSFAQGFHGGIGCNGRGVAMTAMLGEALADVAAGARPEDQPFPLAFPDALPLRVFAGAAPSFALLHARYADWRAGAA